MRSKITIMALCPVLLAAAQSLVILHTNDTHSAIDADANGAGGALARKAVIDSVRAAERNVLLVDAGDMVQGSLYFKLFGGEVEYPVNNMMGYDIRILGNHEFDNGLNDLVRYWKDVKAERLSTNYDFSGTVAEGIFVPSVIKEIDDKKVGFIGINTDPASLILEENYAGMKYGDPIEAANKEAGRLREAGVDLVVAVTHIGYDEPLGKPDDLKLAHSSRDIDIIIGGHSHTLVNPATPEKTPYWIVNSEGRPVLVTQTGKYGRNIGYIKLDLSDFSDKKMDYQLIPVSQRFDASAYDKGISEFLQPYRQAVDSLNDAPAAWSLVDMENGRSTGAYANWTADFAMAEGKHIADSLRNLGMQIPPIDLAIMNVGGIRQPMRKGKVSVGQIMATFPFSNRLRLISLKGSDLIETMRIAAAKGGESVSNEVRVVTDTLGNLTRVVVSGQDADPERVYTVMTIDYLAQGNDDMTPLARHKEIWRDDEEVYVRVLDYLGRLTKAGTGISADSAPRFAPDAGMLLGK